MEKIQVGEYVRTKRGIIGKCLKIGDEWASLEPSKFSVTKTPRAIRVNEIINHSENIIDLIEIGDYVNGHQVYESDDGLIIFNIDDSVHFVNPLSLPLHDYRVVLEWQDKDYIKSIVTKQDFKIRKYEVV